jgi:hypothetical protein
VSILDALSRVLRPHDNLTVRSLRVFAQDGPERS